MYYYGSSGILNNPLSDDSVNCCDFCMKIHCVKFYAISEKDTFLARKLMPKYMKQNLISSHGLPKHSCESCYKKLYLFKHYLRKYLKTTHLNRKYLEKITINFNQNTPITKIKQENIKQEEEEPVQLQNNIFNYNNTITMSSDKEASPTTIKHEYNCQCDSCQNKYGDLPLLVQVIEQKVANEERLLQLSHSQSSETPVVTSSSPLFTGEASTSRRGVLVDLTSDNPSVFMGQPSTSSITDTELVNLSGDSSLLTSSPNKTTIGSKKELKCLHCDKIFSHRGDFNKHLRKHTKERPFSCSECHKKFTHTSNLHRHMRIHSGDKPFVCAVCEKRFNRKDKLDSHKRSKLCRSKTGEQE